MSATNGMSSETSPNCANFKIDKEFGIQYKYIEDSEVSSCFKLFINISSQNEVSNSKGHRIYPALDVKLKMDAIRKLKRTKNIDTYDAAFISYFLSLVFGDEITKSVDVKAQSLDPQKLKFIEGKTLKLKTL